MGQFLVHTTMKTSFVYRPKHKSYVYFYLFTQLLSWKEHKWARVLVNLNLQNDYFSLTSTDLLQLVNNDYQ